MAQKYLDETGLAYLWAKIKAYVDAHGGGAAITEESFTEQGWSYTRIGSWRNVFAKPSFTVTGSYSSSTGRYFATETFTLPTAVKARLADKVVNIQLTTESGGIYDATMVSYNATTCTGTIYISANGAFSNVTVPVYVLIAAV